MTIGIRWIRIPIVGWLLLDYSRCCHSDLVNRFSVNVSIGIGNGVFDVPFIVSKRLSLFTRKAESLSDNFYA